MGQGKNVIRARRGDLVQVHIIVLEPKERAENLPPPTRAVPYEGWVKGFLLDEEASNGDPVRIETLIGRVVSGTLFAINPTYDHNFGEPQPTLAHAGPDAHKILGDKGWKV